MDRNSCSPPTEGPSTPSELACNICLRRKPNSPVVAYCGHVFCWPCLYRSWPQRGPEVQAGPAITKSCPVCGIALREGFNIVPIYGYDNVASPTSGTEQATTTGTTTAAAPAAPDTATSPRTTAAAAAAPVSNTPVPPRPTVASFFTPRPPTSAGSGVAAAARSMARSLTATRSAARAAARAAAAANTPITGPAGVATAVSSDTDYIPPRPNPARNAETVMDAAEVMRDLASTFPGHGEVRGAASVDHPSSSPARDIGWGAALRSIRRRRNLPLNLWGMDSNGANWCESSRELSELIEILEDIGASLPRMMGFFDADDEP